MIKAGEQGNNSSETRARDRSPLNPTDDRNDEDSNLSSGKERGRERDRDRSRRGDRPSRFGPRNSSQSRERERERDHDRERDRGGKKSASERRIFVSNIAYEYRWQELKDLFRTEVGEVAYVELFHDENDKPRGCGIVEFENADSVKKAVEKMHRYDLNGRKLVVKEDYDVERDRYGRPQKGGGGGGGMMSSNAGGNRIRDEPRSKWDPIPSLASSLNPAVGGGNQNKWGNTYGLSPQFLESLWINGPLVTRVFVANLDYKVDDKKLKEVFKLAGKVVTAELSLDKEGKSRGFGVVEYEHPVEAVQAISMLHNQTLYDRKLTVRMDRVEHKLEGPPKLPEGLRGLGMGLGPGGTQLKDVSRNLPSAQAATGLAGAVPAGAAAGLGAGLGAAALSNVVGPSPLGLGNTGLQAGLAGVGGLGGGSLIGSSLGGGGEIGLGGAGAFGGSGLGGGLGPAASGLANLGGGGGGLGGGSSSYGSGLGAGGSGSYGAGAGGGGYGGGSSSAMAGGSGFGSSGRDFDSLSAALTGGAGGYNSSVAERDFRGGAGAGSGYANGPSRGALGAGGNASGNGARLSDTIVVKNLPPAATWQMLRDKFRECGDVKFAEMRGKDIGLVRFSSDWDAERAVHMMDRSRLEGYTIDVCLY
ncbi:myelin expression factor 2-like [Periplaneta americana]|uniref:myelin expression factor 2-like n=1 Tax=Periplaneta americana TaxID=6978 RepID=UPI0037E7B823